MHAYTIHPQKALCTYVVLTQWLLDNKTSPAVWDSMVDIIFSFKAHLHTLLPLTFPYIKFLSRYTLSLVLYAYLTHYILTFLIHFNLSYHHSIISLSLSLFRSPGFIQISYLFFFLFFLSLFLSLSLSPSFFLSHFLSQTSFFLFRFISASSLN